MLELLRAAAPPVLAIACAYLVHQGCARRGLLPPAFSVEGARAPARAWARRVAAGTILALILWIGVFASLGTLGTSSELDLSTVAAPQLFLLHGLMLFAVACWYLLGFGADGIGVVSRITRSERKGGPIGRQPVTRTAAAAQE